MRALSHSVLPSLSMASPIILVLASGRGERFLASGGTGSKLQALLAGKPVIEHTLAAGREHQDDGGRHGKRR